MVHWDPGFLRPLIHVIPFDSISSIASQTLCPFAPAPTVKRFQDGLVDEQLEEVEWRVFAADGVESLRRRRRILQRRREETKSRHLPALFGKARALSRPMPLSRSFDYHFLFLFLFLFRCVLASL